MKYPRFLLHTLLFFLAALTLGWCCLVDSAEPTLEQGAPANKKADDWLAQLSVLVQKGEVDQLIEQVVYNWKASRKDAAWAQVGQLACNLINWEKQVHQKASKLQLLLSAGQNIMPPWFDIGGLKLGDPLEATAREFVLTNAKPRSYLIKAEKIVIKDHVSSSILVSADSIQKIGEFPSPGSNVLLANDGVSMMAKMSVVVCDGEFNGTAFHSLVIARAGVRFGSVGGSVILSGGPVRSNGHKGSISNSVIISTNKVEVPMSAKVNNSIIKQNQPKALGPVKFFDPAEEGIEVELVNNVIRIKKLDPAKIFAKAGLQAGDVLLSLDKNPVKSVEGFRKQLRHSLTVQPQLSFEVRRAEKTITISVKNKS